MAQLKSFDGEQVLSEASKFCPLADGDLYGMFSLIVVSRCLHETLHPMCTEFCVFFFLHF